MITLNFTPDLAAGPPKLGGRVATIPAKLLGSVRTAPVVQTISPRPPPLPREVPVPLDVSKSRKPRDVHDDAGAIMAMSHPSWYHHNGNLVAVNDGRIETITKDIFESEAVCSIECGTVKKPASLGGKIWSPSRPPEPSPRLVKMLFARSDRYFPHLRNVVHTPLIGLPGGPGLLVARSPGYYETPATYLHLPGQIPVGEPSLFYDFVDVVLRDIRPKDLRSFLGVLALIIQAILRPSIGGAVPAFFLVAAEPKSCKTTLLNMVCALAAGWIPSMASLPRAAVEMRYSIPAVSDLDFPILPYNNVGDDAVLESPEFEGLITEQRILIRKAGQSNATKLDVSAKSLVFTGNRIGRAGGLARRGIEIVLEKAPKGYGFAMEDPARWIMDNRVAILAGFLGIVDEIVRLPNPPNPTVDLPNFVRWSRAVGLILSYLVETMNLGSRHDVNAWLDELDDPPSAEILGWIELFDCWRRDAQGSYEPMTSKEIVDLINDNDIEFFLSLFASCRGARGAQSRMGRMLKGFVKAGRQAGGLRISWSRANGRTQYSPV